MKVEESKFDRLQRIFWRIWIILFIGDLVYGVILVYSLGLANTDPQTAARIATRILFPRLDFLVVIYFLVAWFLSGLVMMVIGGVTFLYRTYGEMKHPLSKRTTELASPEDLKILNIARQLSEQLQLSKRYDFQNIVWSSNLHWQSSHTNAGRKKTSLVLPMRLRDRLNTEDWGPILAAVLAQYHHYGRAVGKFLLVFLGFVAVVSLGGIVASGAYGIEGGRLWGQAVGAPLMILGLALITRLGKRTYLGYYEKSAQLFGTDAVLHVLNKIDSLGLPDVEKAKKRSRILKWLWPFPNMTEVIGYLSTLNRSMGEKS